MSAAARLFAAVLLLQTTGARDSRPLPDPQPFFEAVRANLARSQDEQNRFAYKERRTDLNLNPFGRMGTGETRVIAVMPVEGGKAVVRRLIERDGQPVTDAFRFDDAVRQVEFSPDGGRVLVGSHDGRAASWAVPRVPVPVA